MTVPEPAQLRDRLITELGTVRLRLGPNALAMAQRGEAIRLSGNEKDDIAEVALGVMQERTDAIQQGNAALDASVTELREGLVIARQTNEFGRAQLEEARGLMSSAGHNRAHVDDWPDIIPALRGLIAELDAERERADAEAMTGAAIFSTYYRRWQSTIVEARRQAARADAAGQHVEELQDKLLTFGDNGGCCCSYDGPGDVCMVHSPTVRRLEAEVRGLEETVAEVQQNAQHWQERAEMAEARVVWLGPANSDALDQIIRLSEERDQLREQLATIRAYADDLYTAPQKVSACGVRERLLDILTPTGPARTFEEVMAGRPDALEPFPAALRAAGRDPATIPVFATSEVWVWPRPCEACAGAAKSHIPLGDLAHADCAAALGAPTCGNQLTEWTCVLPPGRHHDWQHDDGRGHWWTQTRCPADCGQPNTEHDCAKET